jgi:hypothetical protein
MKINKLLIITVALAGNLCGAIQNFRNSDPAYADEVQEEGQETFISGWSFFNS